MIIMGLRRLYSTGKTLIKTLALLIGLIPLDLARPRHALLSAPHTMLIHSPSCPPPPPPPPSVPHVPSTHTVSHKPPRTPPFRTCRSHKGTKHRHCRVKAIPLRGSTTGPAAHSRSLSKGEILRTVSATVRRTFGMKAKVSIQLTGG